MEEIQALEPVVAEPTPIVKETTIKHRAVTLSMGWEFLISQGVQDNKPYTVLTATDTVGDEELYLELAPQDLVILASLFTTATPKEGN